MGDSPDVSRLLHDWAQGDSQARDQLIPLVYDVLRRLAANHVGREYREVTLQPTALVHEAYMRMVDQALPNLRDRAHFFSVAARLMRQILVDHARTRKALKRGGGAVLVDLDRAIAIAPAKRVADVIALNDAMDALEKIDARKVAIMELRHFGGLTDEETARSLDVAVITVR